LSDIFISYRRQDSDAYAGRLYDRLAARFDKARIFMDIDMDLGIDFANEIEQRVGSCKVLVAVIGRGWLEVKDGEVRRRLDDPNDWVRLELKRLETLAIRTHAERCSIRLLRRLYL